MKIYWKDGRNDRNEKKSEKIGKVKKEKIKDEINVLEVKEGWIKRRKRMKVNVDRKIKRGRRGGMKKKERANELEEINQCEIKDKNAKKDQNEWEVNSKKLELKRKERKKERKKKERKK